MKFIDLRERIKFLKFGYGRATDQLNIEICSNNIDRQTALALVRNIDGQVSDESIDEFCAFVGVKKSELYLIIDAFVNTELFNKSDNGEWTPIYERT